MSKSATNVPKNPNRAPGATTRGEPTSPASPWSPSARLVISGLVAFHLTAVLVAALVAAPPFSELQEAIAGLLRPYINAADLNHGYRFFAPDPGPSHLVRYHLVFADGSTRDGVFPNLKEECPRLLYHRYFMLSEHLYVSGYAACQELKAIPPEQRNADWEQQVRGAEASYRAFAQSYADELLRRSGAKQVSLELVEHQIPLPTDISQGKRLDDKSLYSVVDDLGVYPKAKP